MTMINSFLAEKGIYLLTFILLALGVAGIITCNNYMKKLICMNIMQVAVIFLFLCLGQKRGGTIPVALSGAAEAAEYINPLPHGLMLTAIVVSLGTTAVGLSLLLRIKEKYGTIEEDDLLYREKLLSMETQRTREKLKKQDQQSKDK
ncbi:MAG: cation:proton antiporter subunit C [Mogibacterium sp.]|nr:cation:proton antiporter subunit C [Mogibacterium sp.]